MRARSAGPRRAVLAGAVVFALGLDISPSVGQDQPADNIPLSATFVTEGAVPATEIETGFSFARTDAERQYQFGFSSLAYAWGTTFGLKLVVPFGVDEPRGDGPTVVRPGDVQILAKYAPVVSLEHLFALGTVLKLTVPTGSASRGLGGMLALAPGILAGKAWRLGGAIVALQADAYYSWQLNAPPRPAPDGSGSSPPSPERDRRFTADLTAALSPIRWLTAILEVNLVKVVAGDPGLPRGVQLYLTPGISLEPIPAWSLRVGVQVPVTSARETDYNVVFLATRGF